MSIELEKIAQRRKSLNLTQADLAKEAGVPQGYISRLESNVFTDKGPGLFRVSRVLEALDRAEQQAKI